MDRKAPQETKLPRIVGLKNGNAVDIDEDRNEKLTLVDSRLDELSEFFTLSHLLSVSLHYMAAAYTRG